MMMVVTKNVRVFKGMQGAIKAGHHSAQGVSDRHLFRFAAGAVEGALDTIKGAFNAVAVIAFAHIDQQLVALVLKRTERLQEAGFLGAGPVVVAELLAELAQHAVRQALHGLGMTVGLAAIVVGAGLGDGRSKAGDDQKKDSKRWDFHGE